MARRRLTVFSLSFLDAMTCGLGAVVLLYMVINAAVGVRTGRLTGDLRADADRLEEEVLEGHRNLVELRNTVRELEDRTVTARGLSRRLLEEIELLREELATYDQSTLASRESINKLISDLQTLEEETKRLSAQVQEEETPGDKLRVFVGDGDRQYLTGLKVGGDRILMLMDASASMLDSTIVNVIRRRNLPNVQKRRAEKWQRAVATIDWLTTQIPRRSQFQIYSFNDAARPILADTGGRWLDGGNPDELNRAVAGVKQLVPGGGTSLYHAFQAIGTLRPAPDNVILLIDSLPTRGKAAPGSATISGKQRVRLFNRAIRELPPRLPVNVILFPMEGDPLAASSYWKLALRTGGSYLNPSRDWP